MPRRYILWSVVGALGGIVVNSLRIESNKVNELPYLTHISYFFIFIIPFSIIYNLFFYSIINSVFLFYF